MFNESPILTLRACKSPITQFVLLFETFLFLKELSDSVPLRSLFLIFGQTIILSLSHEF
uniref:Uncharacterized protein n=1 Tax=Lepeophtheirus salmonis TaxID=72036 RepID=A0A0K2T0Y8_LEPSM